MINKSTKRFRLSVAYLNIIGNVGWSGLCLAPAHYGVFWQKQLWQKSPLKKLSGTQVPMKRVYYDPPTLEVDILENCQNY